MARNLARSRGREPELEFAAEFEAPELLTLGIVYERAPRFAGGAYSAFLKKVDRFSDRTLAASLREREGLRGAAAATSTRASRSIIAALQAARLQVAVPAQLRGRAHQPGALPQGEERRERPADAAAQALTRMAAAARTFNLGSVSNSDLAWVAVGAGGGAECDARAARRRRT